MKLGAIKRVCKRDGEYVIYNADDGRQWIGTSSACYEAQGVQIEKECIGALLDVDLSKNGADVREDQLENSLLCPAGDAVPVDLIPMISISRMGDMLHAFSDGKRIFIVNDVYIKPTQGQASAYGSFRLTVNENGNPLIMIGEGMITTAIVKPEQKGYTDIILQRIREIAALNS